MKETRMAYECTNLYSVTKTLRFELKPIGKTQEYIERDGILEQDYHRADSYQKVKKIIDRYHKEFIEESLSGVNLTGLQKYETLYLMSSRDEKHEKEFQEIQTSLRRQIVKCFTDRPVYKKLFKKEMISEEMLDFTKDNSEERALVEEFLNYSTYFEGFHKNRENMYSDEMKSTAIAYRIVHQNLPKFIDNLKNYELLKKTEGDKLSLLEENLREKKKIKSIDSFFELEGFASVLTQSGITQYNLILGGYSEEGEIKIKGINEYINEHNQKLKDGEKKIPKMKTLYKQILSDRESESFVLDKFETDKEVLKAVASFCDYLEENVLDNKKEVSLGELIGKLDTYNLDGIYISNDESLTNISMYMFGDWSVIKRAIEYYYDRHNIILKKKKGAEKYDEIKEKELKKRAVYSVSELNLMLEDYLEYKCAVELYFLNQITELIEKVRNAYRNCLCLSEDYDVKQKLCKDSESINCLKNLLDSIKELQKMVIPFIKGGQESVKDEMFYVELIRISDAINQINPLYNKVRNYVTKKPYSLEKVKLNFAKSTLLYGWDRNKEKDNLGIILRMEDKYYLGIMNRNNNQIMEKAPKAITEKVYQKMEYKLLQTPNRMLPKVFFSKSRIDEFKPDKELLKRYKEGTHKKGEKFSIEDCHRLIDFFKESIRKHSEWSEFNFNFSDTESYEDISAFYREVEQQGYKITFRDIDKGYIDELVDKGQLYLFQIYNKDFSTYSKGKPNLHTLYWKMLFSPENLSYPVYKLNGQAEVFYRKSSIETDDIVCHRAGEYLKNKYPKAYKKTSVFDYDLIKDRRFTVDKYQFHVPVTMNFQADGERYLNRKVRKLIHDSDNIHVIGIDRGERNLLYLSVIDMKGNIVKQKSLNVVSQKIEGDIAYDKDYKAILHDRETYNDKARKNWQTINNIKELKEGYLSQVIHEISQMMIDYNAILVLEDLNFGFKRSRQKVERQVYQKFEKMLIDKLNYLVDKNMESDKNGGLLHAYQLTEEFESFQKLGKQSGFLFYVNAWNTSKIDPVTGFVNLFNTKYVNKEKTREFIEKFDTITYNNQFNCFEFYFDYLNFTDKAAGSRTKWCICSEGNRIESYKTTKWEKREIELTDHFVNLFERYHIDWKAGNIVQRLTEVQDTDFYRSFMYAISLMLQMRNSDDNNDYIMSPVRNESGKCFKTEISDEKYPCDADANGAYNIAKKGLWIVEQLKKSPEDKLDKVNLAISNKEWLAYAQEHRG
jgi:CRISPR-associated protein Cpf1